MLIKKLIPLCLSLFLFSPLSYANDESTIFQTLYGGPQLTYDSAVQYTQVMAQAVYFASKMSGRLVTVGTLTQYAPDLNSFNYTAEPSDKLVIKFMNGFSMEYRIQDLRGDLSGDAMNFLNRDHALAFQVSIPQLANLLIQSQQYNGQRGCLIKGSVKFQNTDYDIDMGGRGEYHFNSDSTGMEYRLSLQLTGSIQDKTHSYNTSVNDTYSHNFVYSRGGNSGQGTSAANVVYVKNSSLNTGKSTYRLDQVQIRKNFKNGKPHDSSYWHASGSLKRDEMEVGRFQLGTTAGQSVDIVLHYGQNQELVLERWPLNGNTPNPIVGFDLLSKFLQGF